MAVIQNILSEELDVIPQGAGTVILRLKGSARNELKGDTGVSGSGGTGAKGDTGSSGTVTTTPDETLLWLAL